MSLPAEIMKRWGEFTSSSVRAEERGHFLVCVIMEERWRKREKVR